MGLGGKLNGGGGEEWYGSPAGFLQHSLHFFPKEGQVNPHHPRCSAGKGVWWPHLWDLLAVSLNDISAITWGPSLISGALPGPKTQVHFMETCLLERHPGDTL